MVEGRIRLTLSRRIEKLDQVKYRRIGVVAQAHKRPPGLLGGDANECADEVRIVGDEVIDLGEPQFLIERNRAVQVANADVHVKEALKHYSSPYGGDCAAVNDSVELANQPGIPF